MRAIDADALYDTIRDNACHDVMSVADVLDFIKSVSTLDCTLGSAWISVKDRLPEKQKPVFVCAKDKIFGYQRTLKAAHVGYHECSTEDYGWQEYEGDAEYDEQNDCFWIPECWYEVNSVEDNTNWIIDYDYEVTHWMELPEGPKEE